MENLNRISSLLQSLTSTISIISLYKLQQTKQYLELKQSSYTQILQLLKSRADMPKNLINMITKSISFITINSSNIAQVYVSLDLLEFLIYQNSIQLYTHINTNKEFIKRLNNVLILKDHQILSKKSKNIIFYMGQLFKTYQDLVPYFYQYYSSLLEKGFQFNNIDQSIYKKQNISQNSNGNQQSQNKLQNEKQAQEEKKIEGKQQEKVQQNMNNQQINQLQKNQKKSLSNCQNIKPNDNSNCNKEKIRKSFLDILGLKSLQKQQSVPDENDFRTDFNIKQYGQF